MTTPQKIVEREIPSMLSKMTLPESNNKDQQKLYADLAVVNAMASASGSVKKKISDKLKKQFENEIKAAIPNEPIILDQVSPCVLTVKVGNPKQQFDLDTFIKTLANEYDLSVSALYRLADQSKKTIKGNTSFSVSFDTD